METQNAVCRGSPHRRGRSYWTANLLNNDEWLRTNAPVSLVY